MASPVQAPPPRYHRRSISGPVILISLGILFLLGTMGYLNWWNLGHWFAHYWPVILIVAGIIKLVEYQAAQRQGYRPSGLGAGGIILMILVIVVGLIATQASRFDWGGLRDEINIDDNDFVLFGEKFNYEDQLSQDFPSGASLRVLDTQGAVNISTSTDNQIHVSVHKRIVADKQADADKYNAGTKPQITVSGNTVTLNANNQGAGEHHVSDDLDISLPRKAGVSVSTKSGDVSVLGRDGDVQITAQHNDVSASDINGKVDLNLEHSSARISQVSSDVSIEGRANDVSLEDIKGSVHLDGEFMETVKLSNIAGAVTFKSSRTNMQFARLDGDLNLDSGDLQANNLTGPLRLDTRSKDIRLVGVSGDVRIEDENGSVELHVKKLGSMQVENRRGDVQIYLPEGTAFQVDARAHGGDVETDFDAIKVENENDLATGAGTIGSGGPHLVLNNDHGTIEIRKGSTEAENTPPVPPKPSKPPHPPTPPKVTEN
jgi:DUF4097 and DUF4098 domain-containing protein YvlB